MELDLHPIERYRRAKGWRQADLAKRLDVSLNTVYGWERGATPQPQRMPRLAEELGVDPLALQDELARWTAGRPQQGLFDPQPKRRRRVDAAQAKGSP